MLLNETGHDSAIGRQGANRRLFIIAHKATVALDISTEDGRELAFHGTSPDRRLSSRRSKVVKRATLLSSGRRPGISEDPWRSTITTSGGVIRRKVQSP